MKVILHIGAEKTGSTALQEFLYANREQLLKSGLALLDCINAPNNLKLVGYCKAPDDLSYGYFIDLGFRKLEDKTAFYANFQKEFSEEISSLPKSVHTVIITSEHFHSQLYDKNEIIRLKNFLDRYFSDVQIICYLREQYSLARSFYSTAIKHGYAVAFEDFLTGATLDNDYYNHLNSMEKWSGVFGFKNILARVYERKYLIKNDIRQDFLSIALEQLDNKPFDFSYYRPNRSLGLIGAQLGMRINSRLSRHNDAGRVDTFRYAILDMLEKTRISKIGEISSSRSGEIFNIFEDSNRVFAEKYLGMNKNPFSVPPSLINEEIRSFEKDVVEDLFDYFLIFAISQEERIKSLEKENAELLRKTKIFRFLNRVPVSIKRIIKKALRMLLNQFFKKDHRQ